MNAYQVSKGLVFLTLMKSQFWSGSREEPSEDVNSISSCFSRQSKEVIVETGTGARACNLSTGETEAGGLPQFI